MTDKQAAFPLPPHVYIPGQTERHPEEWFDDIKASVDGVCVTSKLQETAAFRAGLFYLESGYFWECHEVLEAVWMKTPQGTPEREMVQAVIQLANAQLKILMHRPAAARRLCDMVHAHLWRCSGTGPILGLYTADVATWTADVLAEVDQ